MMGMLSIGGSGGGGEGGCGGGEGGRGGGGGGRFPALLLQLMLMMMPAVCLFNAQPLSSSATVELTENILQPAAHNASISPRTQHVSLGGEGAGGDQGLHGVFNKKTAPPGSTATSPTEQHQLIHSPAQPANSPVPPLSLVTAKRGPPPPVNALSSSNKSEPANSPLPPFSPVTTKHGPPPSPPVNALSSSNTSEASHRPDSPETTSEQMVVEPAEAADNNRPLTTVTAMLLLVAIVLFVGLLHFKVGTALRRRCKSMGCAESLSVGMLKANAVRGLKLACQGMSRAAPGACNKKDEVVIVQSSTGQVFTPVIRMVDQSSGRSAVIYVDQSHV